MGGHRSRLTLAFRRWNSGPSSHSSPYALSGAAVERVKVLLDENIPHDLRPQLTHQDTYTVGYLGWAGLKNGRLLKAADAGGFDVLVTRDLLIS